MELIQNIIFDLGGVLLDIDFARTNLAFEQLGISGFQDFYSQQHADRLFADFEMGKIPPADFYAHVRRICGCELSDDQIRDAWNALLIAFPPERIDWLLKIKDRYRIFLFSNTNILHYQWFADAFQKITGMDFNKCFVKAYYSHEMGLRKPDLASYQAIISEQRLVPSETLFIDDTLKNVEAAKAAGLQAVFLQKPMTVLDLGL